VIFNFGYLGTNKKQSADPDPSCHKYPIPDDTPLPFGHRKIMPEAAPSAAPESAVAGAAARDQFAGRGSGAFIVVDTTRPHERWEPA